MARSRPSLIAICGKNRIAASGLSYTLQALAAWGLDIPIVVCPNRDDRGYDTWRPSLVRTAHLLDVEMRSLEAIESEGGLLLISLEFDRILKTHRFASPRLYNLHFSKLPKYRGVYTSLWPILNGEKEAGVTLHQIDAGIDSGPIIDQRTFPIRPYMTARKLYETYTDEAFVLFKERLLDLIEGSYELTPQDHNQASYYSRKSVDFQALEIDLRKDAKYVCRFVRALSFPEYQLPTLGGRPVQSCHIIPSPSSLPIGARICQTPYSGTYVTGDGRIVELVWA